MAISFTVRPFSTALEDAYKRLFPQAQDVKNIDQLRWRFGGSPHGAGYFAVAEDADTIVGMIALIPTRITVRDEQSIVAYQAVDAIVDPAYRGKGLFVGMGRAAHERTDLHGGRLIWGFPNENAAPGWFGKLGWRNFGKVPFMFRPLRTGYFLRKIAGPLGGFDLPLAFGRATDLAPVRRFDSNIDRLADVFAERQGCGQHRDAQWLNWRLIDRPENDYRCFGHGGERLNAMVATRLADKHGGRILYIMEAMSAPEADDALSAMIAAGVRIAARERADVALAWCPPNSHNRKIYRKAGFFPLPERLRPITMHFGSKALEGSVPPAVGEADAWYLSYLDSDTV